MEKKNNKPEIIERVKNMSLQQKANYIVFLGAMRNLDGICNVYSTIPEEQDAEFTKLIKGKLEPIFAQQLLSDAGLYKR